MVSKVYKLLQCNGRWRTGLRNCQASYLAVMEEDILSGHIHHVLAVSIQHIRGIWGHSEESEVAGWSRGYI